MNDINTFNPSKFQFYNNEINILKNRNGIMNAAGVFT